jgi:hypothetical protein
MHVQHNIAAIKVNMMRTLTALREPAHTFAGGVQFTMMDGPRRVICWVTREALDRLKGHNPGQQDPMACFEWNRLKIEHLASQKYDIGERSPIVMRYDVETLNGLRANSAGSANLPFGSIHHDESREPAT